MKVPRLTRLRGVPTKAKDIDRAYYLDIAALSRRAPPVTQVPLIANWFGALKRHVPTDP